MSQRTSTQKSVKAKNIRTSNQQVFPENIKCWAVLIGISKYKHEGINLNYAHRDAGKLYSLIKSPSGGGFEKERIKLLLNKKATESNIKKALRTFLGEAKEDDIVLIYISGHGGPDPKRGGDIAYLFTHDTDPDDITGTSLYMDEIKNSVEKHIKAKRVIVIADTCHSGAIPGVKAIEFNQAEVVNRYLAELRVTQGSFALLTSAEARQLSLEDKKWGGGHGVFTHYLLEGMSGLADGYVSNDGGVATGGRKDGIVTVGELFEYVREKVGVETNGHQIPKIDGSFDRNWPMAITGGINAQEHFQIGNDLIELGTHLDNAKLLERAAQELYEAQRLSKVVGSSFDDLENKLGQAWLLAGDFKTAESELQNSIKSNANNASSEALLNLGFVQVKQKKYEKAQESFEDFLKYFPDHEDAEWVTMYLQQLNKKHVKIAALLIGTEMQPGVSSVHGTGNDIRLMTEALQLYEADITKLVDQEATRQGILRELDNLRAKSTSYDSILVYYSGAALSGNLNSNTGTAPYLTAYDTSISSGAVTSAIDAHEIDNTMNAMSAPEVLLILDTDPQQTFINLAKETSSYTVLLGASLGEHLSEQMFDNFFAGNFTRALSETLKNHVVRRKSYGQLLNEIVLYFGNQNVMQTPLCIGNAQRIALGGSNDENIYAERFNFMEQYAFAKRKNFAPYTLEKLKESYASVLELNIKFPKAHYSFGNAFLSKGDYGMAMSALESVIGQKSESYPQTSFMIGKAQFHMGDYANALSSFQSSPKASEANLHELIATTKRLVTGQKYALLVGVKNHLNDQVSPAHGAVNDVKALQSILVSQYKFPDDNITILTDEGATREAILNAFGDIAEKAKENFALFYFAGNGSYTKYKTPTIISFDGRTEEVFDIGLKSLANTALLSPNLITIIDAGWIPNSNGSRSIKPDVRTQETVIKLSSSSQQHVPNPNEPKHINNFKIGAISIFPNSFERLGSSQPEIIEETYGPEGSEVVHGQLTYALTQSLKIFGKKITTYEDWLTRATKLLTLPPFVIGENHENRLFSVPSFTRQAYSQIERLDREEITNAVQKLNAMYDQRKLRGELSARDYLNLGLAHECVGDYKQAMEQTTKAIDLFAHEYPSGSSEEEYEARYHLGRMLYNTKQELGKAVEELRKAKSKFGDDAYICYYLAQSIRELVNRESENLNEVVSLFDTYIKKGAPLGNVENVQQIIGSLKQVSVAL